MNHLEDEVESPPKMIGENQNSPRLRIVELILVLAVAFAGPLFSSFYEFFSGAPNRDPAQIKILVFYGLIYEIVGLAVLAYVLFRQGRGFSQLGLTFTWKDIPISFLLTIIFLITFYASYILFTYGHYSQTNHPSNFFDAGLAIGPILFILLNPIYEELIVRAYVMSEIKDLTGSGALAVIISVLIQTLYHLYQGGASALALGTGFLIFALYYARYKRITPVILSHFYFDAFALWSISRH